jgi:hypothetical protein
MSSYASSAFLCKLLLFFAVAPLQFGAASVALEDAEARLWPSFQALPKNEYGRIDAAMANTAANRYFAFFHGLHSLNETPHMAAVAVALSAANHGRGLSLRNLATAIMSLEVDLDVPLKEPMACDRLVREVELRVQAPHAPPERLMRVAEELQMGQQIHAGAQAGVRLLAARFGGDVPLHGEAFEDVMQQLFPADCATNGAVTFAVQGYVRVLLCGAVVFVMIRSMLSQLRAGRSALNKEADDDTKKDK